MRLAIRRGIQSHHVKVEGQHKPLFKVVHSTRIGSADLGLGKSNGNARSAVGYLLVEFRLDQVGVEPDRDFGEVDFASGDG